MPSALLLEGRVRLHVVRDYFEVAAFFLSHICISLNRKFPQSAPLSARASDIDAKANSYASFWGHNLTSFVDRPKTDL